MLERAALAVMCASCACGVACGAYCLLSGRVFEGALAVVGCAALAASHAMLGRYDVELVRERDAGRVVWLARSGAEYRPRGARRPSAAEGSVAFFERGFAMRLSGAPEGLVPYGSARCAVVGDRLVAASARAGELSVGLGDQLARACALEVVRASERAQADGGRP